MNSDNLEGAARGVVGKAQETLGNVTGDGRQQVEGAGRQVAGRAQETYGEVRQTAQDVAHQVGHAVEKQPVLSLVIAGVIGYGLGLLTAGSVAAGSRRRSW